jgi:hypothetical protein
MAKIIKDYSAFRNKSTVAITLLIQHWGNGGTGACIKSAKLLVSDEPVPFVSIMNMSLVTNTMYWTNELELQARFQPADATNQRVIWAIQNWTPSGGGATISLPDLDPANPTSVAAYEDAKAALFEKVGWKQQEYTIDDSVYPNQIGLKNVLGTIIAPAGADSVGTVTVYAIVKEGKQDASGNFVNFEKDITFRIFNPPPLTYKVAGAEKTTIFYGAVDNGGVSGGKMELLPAVAGKQTGYEITLGGGYHNSHHYFEIDLSALGAGNNKVSDYAGIRCHYTPVEGDCNLNGKNIRVRAMLTKPPREYNIGPFLSSLKFSADTPAAGLDLDFEFFKDKGEVYTAGGNADMPDPQTFNNTLLTGDSDFAAIKNSGKVYIWFTPHAAATGSDNKNTKFRITNIELYK